MTPLEKEINLLQTMDAKVWTDEFLKIHPNTLDFDTMISWFANAIMCGYDHRAQHEQKRAEKLKQIIDTAVWCWNVQKNSKRKGQVDWKKAFDELSEAWHQYQLENSEAEATLSNYEASK